MRIKRMTSTAIFKPAWSINDWCRSFGQSRATAYNLIRDGVLEARKSGRKTLLDGASVHAQREVSPRTTRPSVTDLSRWTGKNRG